jgi:tail tube protein
MAFALSRNEQVFLQAQPTYGTIPNASGVATVAVANYCPIIKVDPQVKIESLESQWKTGTRDDVPSIRGHNSATWTLDTHLTSAAAGVVPPLDALLVALFGQPATIVASTSAIYDLSDAIDQFVMWSFRTPTTVQQRVAHGCVASKATFKIGPNIADFSASGEATWVLDSDSFSAANVTEKGGLTAFPTQPSGTLPANMGLVSGFLGTVSAGGTTLANLRSLTIDIESGDLAIHDTFGTSYPNTTEGDRRRIMLSFELYEDDTAVSKALYAAALSFGGLVVDATVGNVTGNEHNFHCPNVQILNPAMGEERRYTRSFKDCRARPSAIAALDAIAYKIF